MRGGASDDSGAGILWGRAGTFPPQARAANDNGNGGETRTITLRRTLSKSGVEVRIKVPIAEYTGVVVSTTINDDGVLFSAIELVHSDPDLNYRVFEEEGNNTVVAEWQNWGRKLGLPLYIRAGDGSLIAYSQQVGGVLKGETSARRRVISDTTRRPRDGRRPDLAIVVSN